MVLPNGFEPPTPELSALRSDLPELRELLAARARFELATNNGQLNMINLFQHRAKICHAIIPRVAKSVIANNNTAKTLVVVATAVRVRKVFIVLSFLVLNFKKKRRELGVKISYIN